MLDNERVRIRLTARNEGVSYEDEEGLLLHFDVLLQRGRWQLYLPGSRGPAFERYAMSAEERGVVLPRIVAFLERVKWFGLFPRSYAVDIVEFTKA